MPGNGHEMTIQAQNRSRRIITLGVGLLALIAIALLLADQLQQTSATGDGPEMRLTVTDPPGVCIESTCTLELEQTFTLAVEIVEAPGIGYTGVQSYIDFGGDLTYDFNAASAEDEIVWPECEGVTALKGQAVAKLNDEGEPILDPITVVPLVNTSSEVVAHGCFTGLIPPQPISFYTGLFLEISVTCSAEDTLTEVLLRSNADLLTADSGSAFAFLDPTTFNITITIAKVSNLTIICGEPPTPTPTPTPTPCPEGKVPANGGCGTPRPSPTPCPEGKVPANGGCGTPTIIPTLTPAVTATPAVTPTPTVASTPTPESRPCGDVNGDGVVNSQDALWVLWLTIGVIDFIPFPADLDGDGTTGPIDALLILQIEANLFICR